MTPKKPEAQKAPKKPAPPFDLKAFINSPAFTGTAASAAMGLMNLIGMLKMSWLIVPVPAIAGFLIAKYVKRKS